MASVGRPHLGSSRLPRLRKKSRETHSFPQSLGILTLATSEGQTCSLDPPRAPGTWCREWLGGVGVGEGERAGSRVLLL